MAGEWEEIPFSEAVLLNPAAPLARGTVYPFVEMSAITVGTREVTCLEHREFTGGGSRFQDRDTLMARITPCLENGKIARFHAPEGEPVGHGSTEFIVVRGRPGVTDNDYAYYLTISPEVRAFAISQMTGSSGRQRVPTDALDGISVQVPSIAEQKAIATVLGALDDKIELNRRMNATLEAMARALFQSWFVDFDPVRRNLDLTRSRGERGGNASGSEPLRASAPPRELSDAIFPATFQESPVGHIPTGWRAAHLGDVVEVFDSKRVPLSGREREQRKGPYPYHGAASAMDYVDDYLFDGIFALMGEDGSVINDNGTPVMQYVWGKFWVNNHAHVLRGKNSVCTEHLLLHLKNSNIAAFVTGAVQPKLNQGNMNRIPFMLPPQEIGVAFAKNIEPLFAKIRANTDQSRTLATLRDTLLPKLLSGELSVNVIDRLLEQSYA